MTMKRSAVSHIDDGFRMDIIYRYQRHIYDASRKYYLLGRDQLIRNLNPAAGCSVLEIGCGTGRNLIAAAHRWPHARLYGFDISKAMLDTAEASLDRRGLTDRIALAKADATDFGSHHLWGQQSFDRIFLSYTLSMVPGWELVLDEAARSLAPTGSIHIVDFGQQEGLPTIWRDVLFAWLRRFDVSPRGDLEPVLKDICASHRLTLDFTALYRGYAWSAILRAA